MTPDRVEPAPIAGMYEVVLGPLVLYMSGDGRYLLRGDLVEVETRRNLTEEARRVARRGAIDALAESSMIVFAPPEVEHTVTVFTDVDCPYCARLHRQIADYNRRGVKVRYLAFPRAGIPSKSYDKTVSVWCSDDPHQAIGDAKFGRPVPPRTCENPVREHYVVGRDVGISGTPTIILENGDVIPGYVPPDKLLEILTEAEG